MKTFTGNDFGTDGYYQLGRIRVFNIVTGAGTTFIGYREDLRYSKIKQIIV